MSRSIILACLLCFSAVSQAARDDVLIVVNDNSLSSLEVGQYYASQRDVPNQNIAHVKSPANFFVSWDQFRSLRDQIIRHVQLNHLPQGMSPIQCVEGGAGPYADTKFYCADSVDQIRQHSTIRYLVTTKGVPGRVRVDNSTLSSPSGPGTVDNYLRHWLINYYSEDVKFSSDIRANAFVDGKGMRLVDPDHDAELIVGRIDGLTTDSAKTLVDRAIAAEASGVYGIHHGAGQTAPSGIGPLHWRDFSTGKSIYGDDTVSVFGTNINGNAWRYQFGMFGESDPECTDYENNYLSFPAGSPDGKSPASCKVKISEQLANEPIPGTAGSRIPLVTDALVYIGNQDGQAVGAGGRHLQSSSFNNLLNWRYTSESCEALCQNETCRQQSTDVLKEINTQCVGVADGFIGYNLQSYPVAYMSAWPTDWHGSNGGENYKMAFPRIREDTGSGDSYSVSFSNVDQVNSPDCYIGTSAEGETETCYEDKSIYFAQTIDLSAIPQNGKIFNFRFDYRSEGLTLNQTTPKLYAKILPYSKKIVGGKSNYYSVTPAALLLTLTSDQTGWTDTGDVQLTMSLDEQSYELNSTKIRLLLYTNIPFTGELGIDNVELIDVDTSTDLIANGGFDQGQKQVSGGDFASNYLSRLNGTAFWGSASHHESGGHSFDGHILETFIYFFRGLPLGDSVWFAENHNSGFLFGDPLYSPVATWLKLNSNHANGFVDVGEIQLSGDALNGTGTQVSTSYQVDYCLGSDFFECDNANSWLSTGLSGVGGTRGLSLGSWTPNGATDRKYVLRLAATTQNSEKLTTQTYYDYQAITVVYSATDYDGDGLSNADEESYSSNLYAIDSDNDGLDDAQEFALGTNPNENDSDDDGVSDVDEVNVHGSDPLKQDTDGDGLKDSVEVSLGTDLSNKDTDGDGFEDGVEVAIGMDPLVADAEGNKWIGTVTGRVTTQEGKGVAGLTFWDVSRYPETVTTDANGYYVIRDYQPGDSIYLNHFAVQGYSLTASGWNGQPFVHDGAAVVARNFIAMQDTGTITGKVLLENGDPLGDITFWTAHRYPETLQTNSDGSFIDVSYVADEWVWPILSGVEGYSITPDGWDGWGFQHDGSAIKNLNYVATQKDNTVTGRITTPDGKPLAGIELWDAINYASTKQVTGSDGRFLFTGYTAGGYVFPITAPNADYTLVKSGWSETSFVHDGSAVKDINYIAVPGTQEWLGTVTGRVTTQEGKGVAGLTFWDVSRYPETVTTDENGYYVIRDYQAGDGVYLNFYGVEGYTLSVSGWNGQPFVHDGTTVVARNFIATQDTGTITGKVILDNGNPLGDATFWTAHRYPATLQTAIDGSFIDTGYVVGEWVWPILSGVEGYTIIPDGWGGWGFQHDGSAIQNLNYVATQKGNTVSGRITTPDGKPLVGIELWDAVNYASSKQFTRSDGRFLFTGYSVGGYVFPITAPNADYTIVKSGWSDTSFVHDGSAIQHINYIAVPK